MKETVIQLGQVKLEGDQIVELLEGRPVRRMAVSDIKRVLVTRGSPAQNPVTQFIVGVAFLILGLLPVAHFIYCLTHDATFVVWEALVGGFAFLGGWVIYESIKRAIIVKVLTPRGWLKFVPGQAITEDEIAHFIREAASQLPVPIERV